MAAKSILSCNMELKVNPDLETLKITLWIAAGVISMLLIVVAFFLRKQIGVSEILTKAVDNLTQAVTVLQTKDAERNPVIQNRLNDHAKRLDSHAERLTTIETKCSIHHKKEV